MDAGRSGSAGAAEVAVAELAGEASVVAVVDEGRADDAAAGAWLRSQGFGGGGAMLAARSTGRALAVCEVGEGPRRGGEGERGDGRGRGGAWASWRWQAACSMRAEQVRELSHRLVRGEGERRQWAKGDPVLLVLEPDRSSTKPRSPSSLCTVSLACSALAPAVSSRCFALSGGLGERWRTSFLRAAFSAGAARGSAPQRSCSACCLRSACAEPFQSYSPVRSPFALPSVLSSPGFPPLQAESPPRTCGVSTRAATS